MISYHSVSCLGAGRPLLLTFLFPVLVARGLHGADTVVVIQHTSTPEADILRARADAVLALKQAQLLGETAVAQRLENMIKESDAAYQRLPRRDQLHHDALVGKFTRAFDVVRFHQQLSEIRVALDRNAILQHAGVGDLTDEMNSLLGQFRRQSTNANRIPSMSVELSQDQLDSICLTDGSNTFSAKTGKTRLETFKWPFFIRREELDQERSEFEVLCSQAIKEIDESGSLSPQTVLALARKAAAVEGRVDSIPLSEAASVRAMETKWRTEAKVFLRELNRTIQNSGRLDSVRLSKYVFRGKTIGELIDHLGASGLRFSAPEKEDSNLYASIFFSMRYGYRELERGLAPVGSVSPPVEITRQVESPPNTVNPGNNPRSRWINETYDQTIYHHRGKEWRQHDNKTQRISAHLTETGRTADYVELSGFNFGVGRISSTRLEMNKGGTWEWVSNGHWMP